jgi:thiamine pyrophosphokinase
MIHMKKRVVIVTNGKKYSGILDEIQKKDIVIGVDHAAYWLITNEVIPDVAVGDFDSTSKREWGIIQKKVKIVKKFSSEKDFTDTELAIDYAIKQSPSSILILGGNGTRIDHTLGTIYLLEQCHKKGIPAVFKDQTNEVSVIGRGRTILERRGGYRYVSIIPISESIVVTLQKFKYNVAKHTIRRGQTIGISNEFVSRQAEITLHRGNAFIIQSRD